MRQMRWMASGVLMSIVFSVVFSALDARADSQDLPSKPSSRCIASIKRVERRTALPSALSEIQVAKEASLNFDSDVARLAELEGRYRENLPLLSSKSRVNGPMKRISGQKYRASGGSSWH